MKAVFEVLFYQFQCYCCNYLNLLGNPSNNSVRVKITPFIFCGNEDVYFDISFIKWDFCLLSVTVHLQEMLAFADDDQSQFQKDSICHFKTNNIVVGLHSKRLS